MLAHQGATDSVAFLRKVRAMPCKGRSKSEKAITAVPRKRPQIIPTAAAYRSSDVPGPAAW